MKFSALSFAAILLTLNPTVVPAQIGQRPAVPGQRSSSVAASPDLKRFELDFAGGTPAELAAAISKATGKHLNLIIPNEHAQTRLMPIKVVGVTVAELFDAIRTASAREMPLVTGVSAGLNSKSTKARQLQVSYRQIAISFLPSSAPVTDETVWSFNSTAPTAEDVAALAKMSEPEQVCQYFQLAPYLEDRTVEDITTAIETGWKMLGVQPVPKLSFHPETKLLIAVGPSDYVAQIPAVLDQLPLDDSAVVEKIAKLQGDLEDIRAKNEPDVNKKASEIGARINRIVAMQKARERLKAGVIIPPRTPVQSQAPKAQ